MRRDLTWFLALMPVAIVLGAIGAPDPVRYAAAALLVIAYGVYVRRTVKKGGDAGDVGGARAALLRHEPRRPAEHVPDGRPVRRLARGDHRRRRAVRQRHRGDRRGRRISALVLSLVLAPLATEMPEKANSVLWVRRGKDALALGNITGAMTFQASIPVALGLAFTDLGARRPRAHGRGHRPARRRARALGHPAPARGPRAGRGLGVDVRRLRGLRGRDRLARALGRLLGLALGRALEAAAAARLLGRPEVRAVDPPRAAAEDRLAQRRREPARPPEAGADERARARAARSGRARPSACSIRCTSRENSSSVIGADTDMPGEEPPRPGPSR